MAPAGVASRGGERRVGSGGWRGACRTRGGAVLVRPRWRDSAATPADARGSCTRLSAAPGRSAGKPLVVASQVVGDVALIKAL